jgi:2,4-dienoyl-CoA reductase-like NADH-dependent reductase (Old Yellow Enzyme family)
VADAPVSLYDPLRIRDVTFAHRIWLSPMCMYSAVGGVPQPWHTVHLGSRAVGGMALVMAEATGVSPAGRITPTDTGLYTDAQEEAFARLCAFCHDQGRRFGIQLAHAGRKASTRVPWEGGGPLTAAEGAWTTLAPSALSFAPDMPDWPLPQALDAAGIAAVVADFAQAAERAARLGADVIELHAAHGYLLHTFLSPLSNRRDDAYGGDLAGRARLLREVVRAVRRVWPDRLPLFVRVSAVDWLPGGITADDTVALAQLLAEDGVDLMDCSSGGILRGAPRPEAPGYHVPFAERVRRETRLLSSAVGLITERTQAEAIIARGQADGVMLGRAALADPYVARRFAAEAGRPLELPHPYR